MRRTVKGSEKASVEDSERAVRRPVKGSEKASEEDSEKASKRQ